MKKKQPIDKWLDVALIYETIGKSHECPFCHQSKLTITEMILERSQSGYDAAIVKNQFISIEGSIIFDKEVSV